MLLGFVIGQPLVVGQVILLEDLPRLHVIAHEEARGVILGTFQGVILQEVARRVPCAGLRHRASLLVLLTGYRKA